ncbi:DIOX domain-containing protein [Artemisia annua]|uniref:DIOX domain-containing protein n=1 Tax=Artemisia annua TaxID=35608 RepID=A0A2U1PVD6_ARTAN|nr:DIOX domain-containing protein [Artemisia annua]
MCQQGVNKGFLQGARGLVCETLGLEKMDEKVNDLQLHKDGEWVDVPSMRHSIIINLGDQIEVMMDSEFDDEGNMHSFVAISFGAM